jgi:hypothetical protein
MYALLLLVGTLVSCLMLAPWIQEKLANVSLLLKLSGLIQHILGKLVL